MPKDSGDEKSSFKLDTNFLWLILFGFGGSLLALYYSRIDYFPEFTWQEALTYLAVMAILGVSITIAYGILLFGPGVIWSETIVFDSKFEETMCYRSSGSSVPCLLSIAMRLAIPFALFMAFCHSMVLREGYLPPLAIFASLVAISGYLWEKLGYDLATRDNEPLNRIKVLSGKRLEIFKPLSLDFTVNELRPSQEDPQGQEQNSAQTEKSDQKKRQAFTYYLILLFLGHLPGILLLRDSSHSIWIWFAAAFPLLTLLYIWRLRKLDVKSPKNSKQDLARYLGFFAFSALLSLVSLLIIYQLVGQDSSHWLHLICTTVVTIAGLFVAMLFRHQRPLAVLVSVASALALVISGEFLDKDGASAMSTRVMSHYGVGDEPNLTLILTPEGEKVFQNMGWLDQGASGTISNVRMLSRMGTEYFLEIDHQKVSLPKKMVALWIVGPLQSRNAPSKESETSPLAEKGVLPSPASPAERPPQAVPANSSNGTATSTP